MLVACGDDGGSSSPTSAAPTTTTAAPGALPAVVDIEEAGALAISSAPFPDWVTIAGDAAWVGNAGAGIAGYDLATGERLASVPSGEICLAMDEGFDSVWAGDCNQEAILRIDATTGRLLATIDLPFAALPNESSIGVDEDGVWVLSSGSQPDLVRIDPATNRVAETFEGPDEVVNLRAGEGALWATRPRTGELVRIDPATGEEEATIEVAPSSGFLAVGEGGVWTLSADTGEVSHVDPATNTVVATIAATERNVSGGDIAVGGGYVWARVSDSLVAQIDPTTDTVVARFGPPSGSGSVDADDDAVWVSAHDVRTVWRLPLS
jgi:virginiamycin B lyase